MYFRGFFKAMILPMYSSVKKMVIIHSIIASSLPYKNFTDAMLSSMTATILKMMSSKSRISKSLPMGVSAS